MAKEQASGEEGGQGERGQRQEVGPGRGLGSQDAVAVGSDDIRKRIQLQDDRELSLELPPLAFRKVSKSYPIYRSPGDRLQQRRHPAVNLDFAQGWRKDAGGELQSRAFP